MKVLIVDDSAFMRRAIRQMLETDPAIEIVGQARNGAEGVELATNLKPDVITLDIEMPEMDGLTALRHIMRKVPTQVLMLSSLTQQGSHATLTALKLGAADFLAKDVSQVSLSIMNIQAELLSKVKALGSAPRKRLSRFGTSASGAAASISQPVNVPSFRAGQFDLICIGSSTGGPPVLENVLPKLPETLKTPIVIAQHMPAIFTKSMAERLDQICPLRVVHAEDGMPVERSTIYISPGGLHTKVQKVRLAQWKLTVGTDPADAVYKPSVNALVSSAAQSCGVRALAVILTGIGDDGLEGCRELKRAGGVILAQNAESCVVYGMPKAVTQAGIVQASLEPIQVAQSLRTLADRAAA